MSSKPPRIFDSNERQKYLQQLKGFFKDSDSGKVVDLMFNEYPDGKKHLELGESFDLFKEKPDHLVSMYEHDCWCEPELIYIDERDNQVWMHRRIQ